jgi:hypothetical protein
MVACAPEDGGQTPDPPVLSIPEAQLQRSVPVFGGTLESAPDIGGMVSADPEGNVLRRIVGTGISTLDLGPNARPFRIWVEGTTAWVTLRGTGELVNVDLGTMTEQWRTPVCGEVRGVTRSPLGPIVVACADGPIVEVGDDGEFLRAKFVATDLRDIVAAEGVLYVSRFTSAEILLVDPGFLFRKSEEQVAGRVAWRMRPDPLTGQGVLVLHDAVPESPVLVDPSGGSLPPTYYGSSAGVNPATGPCGRLHEALFSRITTEEVNPRTTSGLDNVRLTTDFVVGSDGSLAVANTGAPDGGPSAVVYGGLLDLMGNDPCASGDEVLTPLEGRPSAVGFDEDGVLYVQAAGPFGLVRGDNEPVTSTPGDSTSAPIALFHGAAPTGVACASCHPEGLEDGTVWNFVIGSQLLVRRTMPLAGSLLAREPYHWLGDLAGPEALMDETFTRRMGGHELDAAEGEAMFAWLDGLRPVRGIALVSEAATEEGRDVFTRAKCGECHSGVALTTNEIEAVRPASEAVKTPTLFGVGTRSPLLHDGCAKTLEERFMPKCDDPDHDKHGVLSNLDEDDIAALTAYLRTL